MSSQGTPSETAVQVEILRLRTALDSLAALISSLPQPKRMRAAILFLEALGDALVACPGVFESKGGDA
jgi:RNase adaptor protein for sRNA GlmZ degradation